MSNTLIVMAAGEVQEVTTYVDVRALAVLGSVLVPLVVQLLTKKTASEGVKAALALLGSVLVTVLAFVIDPGETVVNWITVTNVFITSLVSQLTAYLAVYKPLGIAGSVAEATRGFGIGSPPTLQTEDVGAEDEETRSAATRNLGGQVTHYPEDDSPESHIGGPADDNFNDPPLNGGNR